jgi:4'-phosphopantetheinyl transferase
MPDDCIDVYVVDLDRQAATVDDGRAWLTGDERARANRFRRPGLARRWLAGRAALRGVLARRLDCAPAAVRYALEAHGKPVLAANAGALHFNLSHSAGLALIAVTGVAPVGVDVEFDKPIADWRAVAARFFSPAEQAQLAAMAETGRQRGFYRCWTRKEAVIKATGEGLSAELTAFDVSLGEPRVLADRSDGGCHRHWQLHDLTPAPGYTAALAIDAARPLRVEIQPSDTVLPAAAGG